MAEGRAGREAGARRLLLGAEPLDARALPEVEARSGRPAAQHQHPAELPGGGVRDVEKARRGVVADQLVGGTHAGLEPDGDRRGGERAVVPGERRSPAPRARAAGPPRPSRQGNRRPSSPPHGRRRRSGRVAPHSRQEAREVPARVGAGETPGIQAHEPDRVAGPGPLGVEGPPRVPALERDQVDRARPSGDRQSVADENRRAVAGQIAGRVERSSHVGEPGELLRRRQELREQAPGDVNHGDRVVSPGPGAPAPSLGSGRRWPPAP